MTNQAFLKYIGLTAECAALIESRRTRPDQAEWEIIREALRPNASALLATYDLGQGVKLIVGESLYLFLNESSKRARKFDGLAEVQRDGLYVEGKRVAPSHGSQLQPAMQIFQRRAGHVVSLSSWRQWHVLRDQQFVSLDELKDPRLARRRGAPIDVNALLAGL